MWIQENFLVFSYQTESDVRKNIFLCCRIPEVTHLSWHLWLKNKFWQDSLVVQGHLFKTGGFRKIQTTNSEVLILRRRWDNLRIFLIKAPPPLLYTFLPSGQMIQIISVSFVSFSLKLFSPATSRTKKGIPGAKYRERNFVISDIYLVWWTIKAPTQFKKVVKKQ